MAIDWTKLFTQYKGKWIALKQDEKTIVGSGKTAAEAFKKAKDADYLNPILTKMPKKLLPYMALQLR